MNKVFTIKYTNNNSGSTGELSILIGFAYPSYVLFVGDKVDSDTRVFEESKYDLNFTGYSYRYECELR